MNLLAISFPFCGFSSLWSECFCVKYVHCISWSSGGYQYVFFVFGLIHSFIGFEIDHGYE